MTTRIIKTWFDGEKIVTQEIPEADFYKARMTKDEALKLALEALDTCVVTLRGTRFQQREFHESKVDKAITAIKGALAQPEEEPDDLTIAYMSGLHDGKKRERALWTLTRLGQEIEAQPAQEPVSHEYQTANGKWHPFIDTKHYQDTVADGRWPIRALYTAPPAPLPAQPAQVSEYECRKLLYGFMLDCNAVGLEQAGKNLHRSMKEKNT